MIPITPTVLVWPSGAGNTNLQIIEDWVDRGGWRHYGFHLSISPSPGWTLKDVIHRYYDGREHSGPIDYFTNSAHDEYGQLEYNTVQLRVIFRRRPEPGPGPGEDDHLVTVIPSPENAGSVSGSGYYRQGSTCSISAVCKCSPWTFDHWAIVPGERVDDRDCSFTVEQDTTCIAYFNHSNTGMLYDQNGKILSSHDGNILYDGNLVTA